MDFDDERSQDHDFGCRLTVLVDEQHKALLDTLDTALETELPDEIGGWPTRFATSWDARIRHKVDLHTVNDFATSRLGVDLRYPLQPAEWLCLTGQSILEVTGGPVFHDTTESYRTGKSPEFSRGTPMICGGTSSLLAGRVWVRSSPSSDGLANSATRTGRGSSPPG
jgi:hypothetical protein